MPLFDALQGAFQQPTNQPQDSIGAALQVPGMGPPASQAEFNQRKQGWSQALQDPALMSGLFQFGLAMMSPGQVGQTSTGHVANALSRGANAVTTTQQLQQKNQLAQQEEARKARSSDAQANLAEAYTRKADAELATNPENMKRSEQIHSLEVTRLNKQIQVLEQQGKKVEAEILKGERDRTLQASKDKVDIDYKKQLTAESKARTDNVGTNTKAAKNEWAETSSKIGDGQTLIRRHNKVTNESQTFILSTPSPDQIDDAIFNARMSAKRDGKELSADDEENIRAKMLTPEIKQVDLPAGNAPLGDGPALGSGVPANTSQEELMAANPNLKMPGQNRPASPATPSSQGEGRKADFTIKAGRVLYPDGKVFQPTTAGQDFKEGLKRAKEEIFELSRMRTNAKDPADKERLTKRILARRKELREKFGSKQDK